MAVTLDDLRGLNDPLKQYNYDFIVPSVPGGGDGEALRFRTTSVSLPGYSTESFEEPLFGFVIKHPGRGTFPRTLEVTFRESEDLVVYNTIRSWYALVWENNTGIQAPEDLSKADMFVRALNNQREVAKEFTLRGSFPEEVGDIEMTGDGSDGVEVSVTFSYDDWA